MSVGVSAYVGAPQYPEHMATFAERMGHRASRPVVQRDELDKDTRTELWNTLVVLKESFSGVGSETYGSDSTEANHPSRQRSTVDSSTS